jgi:hypothetical protein
MAAACQSVSCSGVSLAASNRAEVGPCLVCRFVAQSSSENALQPVAVLALSEHQGRMTLHPHHCFEHLNIAPDRTGHHSGRLLEAEGVVACAVATISVEWLRLMAIAEGYFEQGLVSKSAAIEAFPEVKAEAQLLG